MSLTAGEKVWLR